MGFGAKKDKQMRIRLTKTLNDNKKRYYIIHLYKTLFNNFCVERVYGSVVNRSHTGEIKNSFSSLKDARSFFVFIVRTKIKKGYSFSKY